MLEDLSHHILDIAENSLRAGAATVKVTVRERPSENLLTLSVEDDGSGMDEATCTRVLDPFCTTRTTRKVGLGIPFLKQSAELCGGTLELRSTPGEGTFLQATFRYDSIDRPPLGDIPSSVIALLVEAPTVRLIYRHEVDDRTFELDSRELWDILGSPEALGAPAVALWVKEYVAQHLAAIRE